jgi:ketosteroid isomerase-like protein
MNSSAAEELTAVAHAWDRAMVANDPDAIGRYMADDWVIVGSDGKMGNKPDFLELVRSGALTHDVMESSDLEVRVYGETAVVLARGVSGGHFQGTPFHELERSSSVFVRRAGEWHCILTHLSRLG